VQAGGVGGSKFYLFAVVFPVRCFSSVSPRFYFRRLAFCFLPLAAILEFQQMFYNDSVNMSLPIRLEPVLEVRTEAH
jgi:hypothetical protein